MLLVFGACALAGVVALAVSARGANSARVEAGAAPLRPSLVDQRVGASLLTTRKRALFLSFGRQINGRCAFAGAEGRLASGRRVRLLAAESVPERCNPRRVVRFFSVAGEVESVALTFPGGRVQNTQIRRGVHRLSWWTADGEPIDLPVRAVRAAIPFHPVAFGSEDRIDAGWASLDANPGLWRCLVGAMPRCEGPGGMTAWFDFPDESRR